MQRRMTSRACLLLVLHLVGGSREADDEEDVDLEDILLTDLQQEAGKAEYREVQTG